MGCGTQCPAMLVLATGPSHLLACLKVTGNVWQLARPKIHIKGLYAMHAHLILTVSLGQ